MKDQTLGAIAVGFLAAGTVGAAWALHTFTSADYYCPGPSASTVVPLLAPCQAFSAAIGPAASADEPVRVSLLALGIAPAPAASARTLVAEK